MEYLRDNTFIFLTEIKTSLPFHMSGFHTISNPAKKSHRGGVAIMIKNNIIENITNIDKSYENMVLFQTAFHVHVTFVLCYIAPDDSPYYDDAIFGQLHSVINENKDNVFLIFGDLNARVATPDLTQISANLSYPYCEDDKTNYNGRQLFKVCKDNDLVIINNLKVDDISFPSRLSYRKGKNWISELDYCLVSIKGLQYVRQFEMVQCVQNKPLPSDHAMLQTTFNIDHTQPYNLLKKRASDLGRSTYEKDEEVAVCKSVPMSRIDTEKVKEYLENNHPPEIDGKNEDELVRTFFTKADDVMSKYKLKEVTTNEYVSSRWLKILRNNDEKQIWKAIGWNGELTDLSATTQKPSDNEFKIHFEKLLNPDDVEEEFVIPETCEDVPSLDSKITQDEVEDAIKAAKKDKGYIGVDPGFLKILPVTWILWIVSVFNIIFTGSYPAMWCLSKLIILFKKGCKLLCGNYRGISLTDTLAKLYDRILFNRLYQWMKIDKFQARSQKEKGCPEQMLALLMDYAKWKKRNCLFVS